MLTSREVEDHQLRPVEEIQTTRLHQIKGEGMSVSFLDGKFLLASGSKRSHSSHADDCSKLVVLDGETGALLYNVPFSGRVSAIHVCKAMERVIVCSKEQEEGIFIYRFPTLASKGNIIFDRKINHRFSTRESDVKLDIFQESLAVLEEDSLAIYNLLDGRLLYSYPISVPNITAMKWRSSTCLVLGNGSGLIILFEANTGKAVPYIQVESPISSIAIHPSLPDILGVGCLDGKIQVWDLSSPYVCQSDFSGPHCTSAIWKIEFLSTTIWYCSEDGQVFSTDFTHNDQLDNLLVFTNTCDSCFGVNSFDLNPEKSVLVTISDSGTISCGRVIQDDHLL